MECRLFILCLWVFFILFLSSGSLGCLEQERIGLLELKASIIKDPQGGSLLTWVDDNNYDCCAWERVKCNNATRRVIQLSLNETYFNYLDEYSDLRFLNASLFLPFEELQHLDLSNNYFGGCLHNQGFERLWKLKKLEDLDLQFNHFNNNILPTLGALTSLKTLNLGDNWLDGSPGLERLSDLKKLEVLHLHYNNINNNILPYLGALTSLKTLDLGNNQLNGSLSEFYRVLTNFSNLEVLDLRANNLDDFLPFHELANTTKLKVLQLSANYLLSQKIPPSILSFKNLQALSLQGNEHNDSISGFCELKKLRELDLSRNNFEGILPLCLNNLTSLRFIDFSNNKLSGNIPPSLTAGLRSLRFIDFSQNQLSGRFSPFFIFNLTSLKYLSLSHNLFEGSVWFASEVKNKFQLEILLLSNCNMNTSTTNLVKFLNNQYDLRLVDLSHNKLHGTFPNWLVENNTRLETLIFRNNSLTHIQFPKKPHINLGYIDISNNNIQGQLQTDVGDVFSRLKHLDLSKNGFEGTIPSSVSNMKDLEYLDLSINNFSGEISESLALTFKNLYTLILSNNRLHGLISPLLFNTSNLNYLYLSNNNFTRILPSHIVGMSNLKTLDISQNYISGRIPTWMGNVTLSSLVLRDNFLEGPVPRELCNSGVLTFLDLSQNHLSGSIPSCLNMSMTYLSYLNLQGNKLTGSLPKSILQSSNLMTLDLNHNNLSGSIPNWFGSLQNLRFLLLKGNSLSGSIPREMCQLNKIGMLDLSHNYFSGTIPPCFSNFTFENTDYFGASQPSSQYILSHPYSSLLDTHYLDSKIVDIEEEEEEVEFMTKSRSSSYKGDILNYMTGMDLSCNHFTGGIPLDLGALTLIRALNLSHNRLTGSIPKTLSNLTQLESMDLSHNKLIGEIPSELNAIHTLAVFTVAYNNLSGRLPDMKAQFSTFDETSYEGNPLLCGQPLQKQCTTTTTTTTTSSVTDTVAGLGEKLGIDPISFLASCAASCVVTLLGLVIVLYINPYWRRLWFDFVDACLSFMLPFCSEAIYKVSNPCT